MLRKLSKIRAAEMSLALLSANPGGRDMSSVRSHPDEALVLTLVVTLHRVPQL
jgi:hypothetical protein